jgi:hypothetical protein
MSSAGRFVTTRPYPVRVATLPRYFLHLRAGEDLDCDPDGFEAPDLAGATQEARRVINELWEDWAMEAMDFSRMAVEIEDEEGQVLLTIGFMERDSLH